MADGRSAKEAAATDLCDESRVPRERHKKRVVEHQSISTSLVVHHHHHLHHHHHNINNNNNNINNNHHQLQIQRQCFVLDGTCRSDSETCASDDCHNNTNILNKNNDNNYEGVRYNGASNSDVFNIDCCDVLENKSNFVKSVFTGVVLTGEKVDVKSNPLKLMSDGSKCLDNGEYDIGKSKLILERNKSSEKRAEEIMLLVEYSGSDHHERNIVGRDMTTATVVDAAAAAVAVSAIPETMKEMKKHQKSGEIVARLGNPFKGQIRTAEDTLVGPCGKKRCADRYDSSESSDSGVAVSCGECSSSGTSDITEPGSPCSTSSDEGVAIRGTAPSPLPSLPKLAPPTTSAHNGTRPQWPWTPPLAATACSAFKRLKVEPEAGELPKAGAADPTIRVSKTAVKLQNHPETQGKITEYFKTQIKPQLLKAKKTSTDMSVLVAKSSPEFRRPPTVQRNKGGLAKYLGVVLPNSRTVNDWEVRTMTVSQPKINKLPIVTPRVSVTKLDKKLISKALPGLTIPSEVLASISGCKISSLRLTSDANPKASGASPPLTPSSNHIGEPVGIDFTSFSVKPIVNENNNLTSSCTSANHTRSQLTNTQEHPLSRLSTSLFDNCKLKGDATTRTREDEDEEEEEEEESSRSSGSKPSSDSPILSAPTTIRFPARVPTKNGASATDSGICRWDKCNADFECSGALLEHLQTAHINTQTGGDNFVCHWQGCKVQGRTSCSRRWLERHVLSHGGSKPFRCIVDGCGSRFSSQPALEKHVNNHFNQPETSSSSSRRSCENKLVRRNGKKLRYRRQPWSARIFDYIDTGIMEGLQHRLLELAKTRTQGQLAETPGDSMTLTSQILAKRVEMDGKKQVLLRWHPRDIEPDEWVAESEVQKTKHIRIRDATTTSTDEVSLALYPAVHGGTPPTTRTKQRRKPVKNS